MDQGAPKGVGQRLDQYGAKLGVGRVAYLYDHPFAVLRGGRVGGESRRHIPYGIAMALGLSLAVWYPRVR